MPLLMMQYNAKREIDEIVERLTEHLPEIVSKALDLPERAQGDGHVAPEDIVIHCAPHGPVDRNTKDIEIFIWAHDFPERSKNLEERKETVRKGVLSILADFDRNLEGFVWILLQPTAFGQL